MTGEHRHRGSLAVLDGIRAAIQAESLWPIATVAVAAPEACGQEPSPASGKHQAANQALSVRSISPRSDMPSWDRWALTRSWRHPDDAS